MNYKILQNILDIAEGKEPRVDKLNKLNDLLASNYRTDKNHNKRLLSVRDLVFRYYGFNPEIAKLQIKAPEILIPKQVYAYLVVEIYHKKLGRPTLGEVAGTLGLISHATILSSVKKITGYLSYDDGLVYDLIEIRKEIENTILKNL